jgi:hypothetical protein
MCISVAGILCCTALVAGLAYTFLDPCLVKTTSRSCGIEGCWSKSHKEAHIVRVHTRVRFQRRGFRSPIQARTRKSESKGGSDLLWTPESESKGESDLLWTLESESKGESNLLWTGESESKGESDLLWTGESDRVRVQGGVRSGKAFT